MRICVFGDVHGNGAALSAVLAALPAEAPDLCACTGDVVFGWGQPEECVDGVRALGCLWVTGNADQVVLGNPDFPPPAPAAARAPWDRERLGPARLRVLAALPTGAALQLPRAGSLWLAHGCPPARIEPGVRPAGLREWSDNVADDRLVAGWFGSDPPALFLCGHTHVPTARRIGATLVVNPGSVGYGIHHAAPARYQTGNAVARYAVLDWAPGPGWTARMRQVPYATAAALAGLEGLPWADGAEIDRRRAFLAQAPAAAGPEPVGVVEAV